MSDVGSSPNPPPDTVSVQFPSAMGFRRRPLMNRVGPGKKSEMDFLCRANAFLSFFSRRTVFTFFSQRRPFKVFSGGSHPNFFFLEKDLQFFFLDFLPPRPQIINGCPLRAHDDSKTDNPCPVLASVGQLFQFHFLTRLNSGSQEHIT